MIVNEGNRIAWSALHNSVVEYRTEIILGPLLTRIVEVVMEWDVEEGQLSLACQNTVDLDRGQVLSIVTYQPSECSDVGLDLVDSTREIVRYTETRRS